MLHLAPSLSAALAISAAGATAPPRALPDACTRLGAPLVDHACFHALHGPFGTVAATPGIEATAATPALDAVHTYFDIALPGPAMPAVATYRIATPARAGAWAVFHHPDVPLRVLDPDGRELMPLLEQQVETCPGLRAVAIYELADVRYRLVLGPSERSRALVVVEFLDDFLARQGRDADGDGHGSALDVRTSPCAPPPGYAADDADCDDTNPAISPSAIEHCGDAVDANCNGALDDAGLPCVVGAGACASTGQWRCATPSSAAVCDAPAIAPGAERCDGIDQDCDGVDDTREVGACSEADAPSCVRWLGEVGCGCDDDAACAPGRCDLDTRRCVDAPAAAADAQGCASHGATPGVWLASALVALISRRRRATGG